MSKNRNRAKLKKAYDSQDYNLILKNILYPAYWDDGFFSIKGHSSHKYRSYKTWKHSRKTQYKDAYSKQL